MRSKLIVSSLFIFFVCFTTCKRKSPQQKEAEKIVAEWIGKTIAFPDEVPCIYPLQDSIATDCFTGKPFKVLLYTDSIGCTSCKLRFFDWENIIQEVDSAFSGKVDFLFYFQPKNEKELKFLFKRDRFKHPVFLDTQNKINKLNSFPSNSNFQCFLLDADNKVLSIGNPSFNPDIWKLYKQIISGEMEAEKGDKNTTVSVEKAEIHLENLVLGEITTANFVLKNTGNNPLVIYDIKSMCGCTVPAWVKQPVEPGKNTTITIEVEPEENVYFNKTIKVYCNAENSPIRLEISGMVKERS